MKKSKVQMIRCMSSVAALILLITACSSYPTVENPWPSDWVDASAGIVSPSNSIQVSSARISTLSPDEEAAAEQWLLQNSQRAALLSEMPGGTALTSLKGMQRTPGEEIYLVRGASDGGNGVFTGYVNEAGILILYNVMGECGLFERRVLAVSLRDRPERVYGGCSGAL